MDGITYTKHALNFEDGRPTEDEKRIGIDA